MATPIQLDATAVIQACQDHAQELAAAIGFCFSAPPELKVGEAQAFSTEAWENDLRSPGLLGILPCGDHALLLAIPEPGEPEPSLLDVNVPDELGRTVSELLLPSEGTSPDARFSNRANLAEALQVLDWQPDGWQIPVEMVAANGTTQAWLLWSASVSSLMRDDLADANVQSAATTAATTEKPRSTVPAPVTREGAESLSNYSRSLLRIRVPVMVTLASKKQPLNQILELGPGSIIQFEKPCDEMLDLEVGGHRIAAGEAVKVGDKFGIRIMSMILPEERFEPLARKRSQEAGRNTGSRNFA